MAASVARTGQPLMVHEDASSGFGAGLAGWPAALLADLEAAADGLVRHERRRRRERGKKGNR